MVGEIEKTPRTKQGDLVATEAWRQELARQGRLSSLPQVEQSTEPAPQQTAAKKGSAARKRGSTRSGKTS